MALIPEGKGHHDTEIHILPYSSSIWCYEQHAVHEFMRSKTQLEDKGVVCLPSCQSCQSFLIHHEGYSVSP